MLSHMHMMVLTELFLPFWHAEGLTDQFPKFFSCNILDIKKNIFRQKLYSDLTLTILRTDVWLSLLYQQILFLYTFPSTLFSYTKEEGDTSPQSFFL